MATNSVSAVLVIFAILITTQILSISTVGATGDHQLGWIPTRSSSSSTCEGSIAECQSENEFEMDSEISRRILATSQYISYEALKKNTVPCSRRGASYYNCQPGAQANPYNRGCSAITRCRS
ncbi:Rapid ALkalinization Factor [Macleaya cordata]|uniref:Rapid ALkalinization Factor n=1 Tax=Macleaya cordata TaxID=56857 RepID=A0A200QWN9_MACCD|nr:Rapid ALkalinization Factor [Macleaya cordata]